QPLLQQAGRGREHQVRGGGAEDDQVDLRGVHPGRLERTQRGLQAEVDRGLALGGDVALADAGARGDPFVAGVDDLRQVVVGQYLGRQVAAGTGDAGIDALAAHRGDGPRVVAGAGRRGVPVARGPVGGPVVAGSVRTRAGSVFFDGRYLGSGPLLAAVVAVGGDVVALVGCARVRVGSQLLGRERVVGSTHATTGRGDAGLLHSHGIAPETILLLRLLGNAMTARDTR